MHDRVASLGGSLTIDAGRGQGARVTGSIPLGKSSARPGVMIRPAGQGPGTPATSHGVRRHA